VLIKEIPVFSRLFRDYGQDIINYV